MYDPGNARWVSNRVDVANRLVNENTETIPGWVDALRPVAEPLSVPLIAIFRSEKRGESERNLAAYALAEYFGDQPGVLLELLMDATETQFGSLYRRAVEQVDQIAPLLEVELGRKPQRVAAGNQPTEMDNNAWDRFYKRQANAAVALIRMGRLEKSWPKLKHSSDPSLRTYLVHRLGPLGFEPGTALARLAQESDVSIRRALILSLGEYGEGRLATTERVAWMTKLIDLYRQEPDPGIHGAADWLLRLWGQETQVEAIDKELAKLPLPTLRTGQGEASPQEGDRRWFVNRQGQTMTVIPGPVEFEMEDDSRVPGHTKHRERIGRSFAIATKELTVEQFQRFQKENPFAGLDENQPSLVATCPRNFVSWCDAASYCNWLSKQEGIPKDQWCYAPNEKGEFANGMKAMSDAQVRTGYRLPTEAEWEYSCRAGAATGFSFGEPWVLLANYGWFADNSHSRTWPVGRLKPNDLGLFDLYGNVWEWCQDEYNDAPEDKNISINTLELYVRVDEKVPRLLRGGSFVYLYSLGRSVSRSASAPVDHAIGHGFRPARTYR